MRIVIILLVIVVVGVFCVAYQQKPVRDALKGTSFGQTLNKVFGEKLHAATSKPAPNPAQGASGKTTTGSLNRKNLGVLPLSDHVSTTVPLDQNTQCTLTPTLLKSGNLQIILTMETTGADGKPAGMNVARVVTHPGEPFDVSIGTMDLAFTPQIAVQ